MTSLNTNSLNNTSVFESNWTHLLAMSLDMNRPTTSELSHKMVSYDPTVVDPILAGLVDYYLKPLQYKVKDLLSSQLIPKSYEYKAPFHSYLFRKISTSSTVTPNPNISVINFREFIRGGSPDGIYNWVLCMHDGKIGIYCKQLYPLLPCADSINHLVYDIVHGSVEGVSLRSPESTFTIITAGQFITATNHDGHKLFNINISKSSLLSKESCNNDIIDSPLVEDFLEIMFKSLGPTYTNQLTFNVELDADSYLRILPAFTIDRIRDMVHTFSTVYGYAAYEFDNTSQIERKVYNRSTQLEIAKYKSRRELIERELERALDLSPGMVQTQSESDYTLELMAKRPLTMYELAQYRIV
jgi:hypothetical protein